MIVAQNSTISFFKKLWSIRSIRQFPSSLPLTLTSERESWILVTIQSQIPCQKENHGEIKKSRALLSSFSLKLMEVSTAGHVTGTTSPRRHANRILGGAHGVKTEKIVPRLRGEVRVLSPFSPSSHSLALDRPPLLLLLSLSRRAAFTLDQCYLPLSCRFSSAEKAVLRPLCRVLHATFLSCRDSLIA